MVAGEDERYRDLGEFIYREVARKNIYWAAVLYLGVVLVVSLWKPLGSRLKMAFASPALPVVLSPVLLGLSWYYFAVAARDEYNTFGVFHLALLFLLCLAGYLLSCLLISSSLFGRLGTTTGVVAATIAGPLIGGSIWIIFAYHYDYLWIIWL